MSDAENAGEPGASGAEPDAVGVNDLGRAPHRVAASTVTLVASNTAVAALGALAVGVLTRKLGSNDYGILVSVLAFNSIAILFGDLGINTYSGREIARRSAEGSEILGQNLGLRLVMSVAMIPTVIGIGFAFPNSETARIEGIALVALTFPCEAVRSVSLSYYVATIQNYKTAVVSLVSQVVYVSGALIAIHLGYNLIGCFVAYDISMIVTAATAYLMVRRNIAFGPRFLPRTWLGIIRQSFGVGAIQIVNVLYLKMNTLMLTAMTTYHTVAQYGVAAAIVTYLLVLPNAFMLSMLPLVVGAPLSKLTALINSAAIYMAIAGVLCVTGTTCLARDVVDVLAPGYHEAIPTLQILGLSVLFTCMTVVFTYSSFARDHHRRLLIISCSGLVGNGVLDLLLIPWLGARGAATSTVAVELCILVGTYAIFRSRVGNHFTAWAKVGRVLIAGLLTFFVSRFVLNAVMTAGRAQLVLGIVLIPLLLSGALVLLRCLPNEFSISRFLRDPLGRATPST